MTRTAASATKLVFSAFRQRLYCLWPVAPEWHISAGYACRVSRSSSIRFFLFAPTLTPGF